MRQPKGLPFYALLVSEDGGRLGDSALYFM